MNTLGKIGSALILGLLVGCGAVADTLELKDGRVLQGKYLGGTRAVLRFEVNGGVQTFRTVEIVAITFTSRSVAEPAAAPSAPVEPRATPRTRTSNRGTGEITIPAGQAVLVRMIDGVDSSKNQVGDVFHASLETDLLVDGIVAAPRGTDVYGRLSSAQDSGHMTGRAELQLELTRMMLDGREYPLVSNDYDVKGKSRGSDTAKKVGGGAIAGAVIGAIAGGGKGAAIGAGVGSAAGAGVQVVTHGDKVKVPSETLLEFRLQQPVTLNSGGE